MIYQITTVSLGVCDSSAEAKSSGVDGKAGDVGKYSNESNHISTGGGARSRFILMDK